MSYKPGEYAQRARAYEDDYCTKCNFGGIEDGVCYLQGLLGKQKGFNKQTLILSRVACEWYRKRAKV